MGLTAGINESYWEDFYNQFSPPTNQSSFAEYALKRLKSILPDKKDLRLLDIGCGNGRDTFYFHKNNILAMGIDPAYPKNNPLIKKRTRLK